MLIAQDLACLGARYPGLFHLTSPNRTAVCAAFPHSLCISRTGRISGAHDIVGFEEAERHQIVDLWTIDDKLDLINDPFPVALHIQVNGKLSADNAL